MCFIWVVGLRLFFFLFLVLWDSSVSILLRKLNLFLVSAVWFGRVITFSRSHPDDDPFSIVTSVHICHSSVRDLSCLRWMKVAGLAIYERRFAGDFLFFFFCFFCGVVRAWAVGFFLWFYFSCFVGCFFICTDWSWLCLKFSRVQVFQLFLEFGSIMRF